MTNESYEDILKRQWANVPKEKLLPVGTWELKARSASFLKPREEGKSAQFMFVYEPLKPMDDVDPDKLAELGAEYDLGNNRLYFKMWYETARDLDALRNHIAKHGVDVENGTIEEALKAVKGTKVAAYLDVRSFQTAAGETVTTNDPKNFVALS